MLRELGADAIDSLLDRVARENKRVHQAYVPDVSPEGLLTWFTSSRNHHLVKSSEGDVSFVRDTGDPLDYSANAKYFAAHTDGLSYAAPPQFSVLACLSPGSVQASTYFIDTTEAISLLKLRAPDALTTLRKLDQVFLGRDGREFHRRLIEVNPLTGEEVMNITLGRAYVRPSQGLFVVDVPHQREQTEALQILFSFLETATLLEHRWASGDVLVWDNHRFIHGRLDASHSIGRLLARAWFSRSN